MFTLIHELEAAAAAHQAAERDRPVRSAATALLKALGDAGAMGLVTPPPPGPRA